MVQNQRGDEPAAPALGEQVHRGDHVVGLGPRQRLEQRLDGGEVELRGA
jgi:hypothetical protein